MYKGKNLLTKVTMLLLHFRFNPIAITAHIEKAYHQIAIKTNDHDYVHFLFIKNLEAPINMQNVRVFHFCRVNFGIIASPFLLAATISYHLNKYQSPSAQKLCDDLYVDNLVTTTSQMADAEVLYREATQIFQDCRMNLRMWNSNSQLLKNHLLPHHRKKTLVTSVLGLQWNTEYDTLTLALPKNYYHETPPTLHLILKQAAQIYDVLGFFAPNTICTKILMQNICLNNLNWDDPLPSNLEKQWATLSADLQRLLQQNISQYLVPSHTIQLPSAELHVFSDASKQAYATAVYLRVEVNSGVKTELLISKSRIPKLNSNFTFCCWN